MNASAVSSRASRSQVAVSQRPPLGDQRLHLAGRGPGRHEARAAVDQLGIPGEVTSRAGPITRA